MRRNKMNSEKVKEIKKALEDNANGSEYTHLAYIDDYRVKLVAYRDILTLINELESENERLKQLREVDYKTMTILRRANTELNECMDEMQDRIAELESELEKEQINNLNCDTELQYKEKRIDELEKENDEKYKRIMELERQLQNLIGGEK